MTQPTQEQQRILEEVLCGDRAPDDPEVVAARRDPAFAALLAGMLGTAERLAAAGATERVVLTDVAHPTRGARRWGRVAALAAAVLLLATGIGLWLQSRPRPPEFLGGDIPMRMAAPDYAEFAIDVPLPAGGWFEITVHDGNGLVVHREPKWTKGQWQPAPAERAIWPEPIVIRVRMFDAQGDRQGDGGLRCWRQSGG